MRCSCCDRALNDYESTAKDLRGVHLDTCRTCLDGLGIAVLGRPDLDPDEESDEFEEYIEWEEDDDEQS